MFFLSALLELALITIVLKEYGTILKALSTTNKSLHDCYLEELRILPEGKVGPIKSLQILHNDRSLFVGLDDRLVKIPLERCSSYPAERFGPRFSEMLLVFIPNRNKYTHRLMNIRTINMTEYKYLA